MTASLSPDLDAYLRDVLGPAVAEGPAVHELLRQKYEPVAIVGIGVRFPGGCDSVDDFDTFLAEGRSGIRPLPEDRWNVAAFAADDPADPEAKGKIRTTGGGFLERIDLFDATFFNISPKEAQYIDPQQRMVLETAWQALEHANIDPTASRRGSGGVYIGASSIDYALELDALPYEELDGHLASGITMFPLSGRLSYFLGWRGPSVSVDTACSSSLAALHMAVQGLRNGETDIALCGGVNALHHPRIPVMFSHANMLAPDGLCKTFDESADGYVRAEGCGILVLKRLSDAVRDGDTVHAVVRGTAVGQDGDSAGLTVPNGAAQEQVMRGALRAALLEPGDVQYVEAHGTGTPLGDPIELGAINDAFAAGHSGDNPLLVGSVKTNLGHMEPASGVVGVIKAVLQLRSGTVYPHLNLHTPSGRIPWDVYPLRIATDRTPYPRQPEVRRALVNSFGFAGTIGAAVLEQAPEAALRPAADAAAPVPGTAGAPGGPAVPRLFTLSAKSAPALREQAARYRDFLAERPEADLDSLCYTAHVGRAHFPWRVAAPVADHAALAELLDRTAERDDLPAPTRIRKVDFLFSGQGSQYPGMGAALYARFPVFRRWVDECDHLFAPLLKRSVRDLVVDERTEAGDLNETVHTQPSLFTLEFALAQLWLSWGVRPQSLVGHSIGEVTAAAVAGVFTLPDAVTLVAARARLMQSVQEPGGMAAAAAGPEVVEPLLEPYDDLALAAVNAPDQCVVSGGAASLDAVMDHLVSSGVRVDRLAVSHAFHSPLMAEVFDDFRAALDGIAFHRPRFTLVSDVTGRVATPKEIRNAEYWVRHIGEPVRFMDAVRTAARSGRHAFVEIGPATALTALARRCLPADEHLWLTSLHPRTPDGSTLLHALAGYYTASLPVDWTGYHADDAPARMSLPTYAFQRKRHWLPVGRPGDGGLRPGADGPVHHPLLGTETTDRADTELPSGTREFTARLGRRSTPAWYGLRTPAGPVLPAAAYADLMLALQDTVYGQTTTAVRELRMHGTLALPEEPEATVTLRTRLTPGPDGAEARTEVCAENGGETVPLASAILVPDEPRAGEPEPVPRPDDPASLLGAWHAAGDPAESVPGEDVYTDLTAAGRDYDADTRGLLRVTRTADGLLAAELEPSVAATLEHLPSRLLEAALHALTVDGVDGPSLTPVRFRTVRLRRKPRGGRMRVLARPSASGATLVLLEDGRVIAELTGVEAERTGEADEQRHFLHRLQWLRRTAAHAPEAAADHHAVVVTDDADRSSALTAAADRAGVRLTVATGAAALAEALHDPSVTDVAWMWRTPGGPVSAAGLRAECEANYRSLLDVVGAVKAAAGRPPRLWLVTEGAQTLPGDRGGDGQGLAQATLWGFGRTLLNEEPQLRTTLVDLPPDGGGAALLVAEWLAREAGEFQVAYRAGRRHVRALLPSGRYPWWDGGFAIHGTSPEEGGEAVPSPVPAEDREPVADEVQVRMRTVQLTATDVDRLRAAEGAVLGTGGTGVVTAAGPDASFAAGDQVVLRRAGTLRSTVTLPSAEVSPLPEDASGAVADSSAQYLPEEIEEALADTERGLTGGPVTVLLDNGGDAGGDRVRVRGDRTYLITGGLGGLGLVTARKLVDLGARHLVLVSRSGKPTEEAAPVLEELSHRAEVTVIPADVAVPGDVDRVAAALRDAAHPLGGVVHAAGAIGKALVSALDWEDIDRQLAPKVYGSWLLHEATASFGELEFFVCYSSIASVVGGATQAHYAAASAFLDALTEWRAGQGLPATAVNWGAWAAVGMSARLDDTLGQEIERGGITFFSPSRALRALERLWQGEGVRRVVGEVDWRRFTEVAPVTDAFYRRLASAGDDAGGGVDVAALLDRPGPERAAVITALVEETVTAALRMTPGDGPLDPTAEFVSLGLDSLMGMELKTGLEKALGLALPASLAFDHPSVQELVRFLDRRLSGGEEDAAPPVTDRAGTEEVAA